MMTPEWPITDVGSIKKQLPVLTLMLSTNCSQRLAQHGPRNEVKSLLLIAMVYAAVGMIR